MLKELLTSKQLDKFLQGGYAMSNFITSAFRAKCTDCGSSSFKKKKTRYFSEPIPVCIGCEGEPSLYRVCFSFPKVGTNRTQKLFKTRNELGEPLDSIHKAYSFLEYVKNRVKQDGESFDPREFGTAAERDVFLVRNFANIYLDYHLKRMKRGEITPAGYAKKKILCRNHVIPLFGEYSLKQVNYSLVERVLAEGDRSQSSVREVLGELSPFLKYAAIKTLIQSVPALPKKPKLKTFKISDFYSIEERDLVIRNIKKRNHQIAITILAKYTRRKSEIECLRWKDFNFKTDEVIFRRHLSDGKGVVDRAEIVGLKSSPEKELVYDFFPGFREMLLELTPSLNGESLVFPGRNGNYIGKNVLTDAWNRSVDDLVSRRVLKKKVDLHRGTRNSTLSGLFESGIAENVLVELYGGDAATMKRHYAKKRKQLVPEFH